MSINVLFFASLRERLGKAQCSIDTDTPLTVREVWQRSSDGAALPANVLVSVNQAYASLETLVQAGDEVAFFPPVTGG